jgi:hypothetical protein
VFRSYAKASGHTQALTARAKKGRNSPKQSFDSSQEVAPVQTFVNWPVFSESNEMREGYQEKKEKMQKKRPAMLPNTLWNERYFERNQGPWPANPVIRRSASRGD